jgi:hypothetical protein
MNVPSPLKPSPEAAAPASSRCEADAAAVTRRHLRAGWWCLLIFLTLGLVLEGLQGFKVGAYLNVSNETRRLMWRLSHAHGTLLGLVNLAFAFTLRLAPEWKTRSRTSASWCLRGATVLMPAGFFLGGISVRGGDPGLGILLVPVGGVLLFAAVIATALAVKEPRLEPRGQAGKRR